MRIHQLASPSSVSSTASNSIEFFCEYVKFRARLAGEKPNSVAIFIMISNCLFACERYGDCIGYLREVAGHPELRETALRAIDEAAAVAAAEGLPMSQEETTETFHELVAPHGSHRNKSSMRRDIDNRRPSEVAYIYGTVVALGDKHGIPTPTLKTLVAIIKGIEQHYVKPREASGAAA